MKSLKKSSFSNRVHRSSSIVWVWTGWKKKQNPKEKVATNDMHVNWSCLHFWKLMQTFASARRSTCVIRRSFSTGAFFFTFSRWNNLIFKKRINSHANWKKVKQSERKREMRSAIISYPKRGISLPLCPFLATFDCGAVLTNRGKKRRDN